MLRALGLLGRARPARCFAKASKKRQDQLAHDSAKREANVPEEISFEDIEAKTEAVTALFAGRTKALVVGRLDPEQFAEHRINAYGKPTALRQLCQVSALSPVSVQISPFDPGMVMDIAREFDRDNAQQLEIAMTETKVILSLSNPNMREARQHAVRRLKEQAEQAKQRLRELRKEKLDQLKRFEKFLAADLVHAAHKEVDRICAAQSEQVEAALKAKEKQLLK